MAAQRVVADREDVRTPATPVVALSASGVRRGDVRPIGHADVRCPRVRCPRVRCHPGVRTDGPPVSAALQPPCPDRAGPGARCGEPSPLGAMGLTCRRGPRAARSTARIGPEGKGWCCVGRGWLARGSTADLGRRIARGQAAAPPRRLADKGAGPAPGWRGRLAGEHENERVLTSPPQVRPGQVVGVVPDHGLDREVVTTLCGRWAGDGPVSSVRRTRPVRPGSRLRPQRGRGT
jgi:hypothetical protein